MKYQLWILDSDGNKLANIAQCSDWLYFAVWLQSFWSRNKPNLSPCFAIDDPRNNGELVPDYAELKTCLDESAFCGYAVQYDKNGTLRAMYEIHKG